ncbi:glycosyl hydrolase-related protein [Paenibacillus sp. TAB 01]|uniref:glycosyl hydrolase-related protein n=1 Tax=Paenibacillus sp. TAB 01 TaxID=3368988 RepID=UPI00375251C4
MIQTSDNHGPHDASVIQEMKASIEEAGLSAELHIGSLGDFAEDFLSRNPELPVIRGDMADSWIHGVGTAPRGVSRVRELRGRIAAAESALAVKQFAAGVQGASGEAAAAAAGLAAAAKAQLDAAYEQTLLFGEHTWGLDCKTFLFPRTYDKPSFHRDKESERYRLMEASWREQEAYLDQADSALRQAVEAMSAATAASPMVAVPVAVAASISPSAPASAPASASGELRRLRVYNALGWRRDAETQLTAEQLPAADELLVDLQTGEPVSLVLAADGSGAAAQVKGLPALGYKTLAYVKKPSPAAVGQPMEGGSALDAASDSDGLKAYMTETGAVLENRYLIVKVSRSTGWISSLWDKRLRKEWIDPQASAGFGQYEYNVYSSQEITRYLKKYAYRFYDWGVHDFGKTNYPEEQQRVSYSTQLTDLQLVRDGAAASIRCTAAVPGVSVKDYGNAREIQWQVTLTEASRYIDMEWKLTGKEETPKAESGHILFPLKLERPQFRINKLGTVIDPCTDLVPSSSTLVHCCEHFVDITNGFAGMAVIPLDSPLFFLGKNGMWDFEPDYKPVRPEINFNLFNNWWGTNFPQWIGGELRYRYRLVPHEGDWVQGEVWKTALETMTPPIGIPSAAGEPAAEAAAGEAAVELLVQELSGMAVSCFKPAEDGQGFILRLRECLGQSRELKLMLDSRVREVRSTDLLERDIETVHLQPAREGEAGGAISLSTRPFELQTLRILT